MKAISIGATYSTTNSNFPEVRVICELSRETDKRGNIIGECRGYQVQVVDGTYHRPMTIDANGFFQDYDGRIDKMTQPTLRKYK